MPIVIFYIELKKIMSNKNTLPEILSDTEFQNLTKFRLLNEKAIRDYKIRKRYNQLRKSYAGKKAYELISLEYPELKADTIRKIIYSKN